MCVNDLVEWHWFTAAVIQLPPLKNANNSSGIGLIRNNDSKYMEPKSALAPAKASSNVFIGIDSNYLMAYPWLFSLHIAMMKHMVDVLLCLLAPCNEPLTHVTFYLPCAFLVGIMSDHQFGNQFMCSVVASHVSHLPTTNLSFVWIAPPAGTGCVNFMYVSWFLVIHFKDLSYHMMI